MQSSSSPVLPGPLGLLQTLVTDGLSMATGLCCGTVVSLVAVVALSSPMLFVPLFVCWKVDGTLHWTWTDTLFGLWAGDALLLVSYIVAIAAAESCSNQLEAQRTLVAHLCFITTHVFVALRLDGIVDWEWSVTFVPVFVSLLFGASPVQVLQVLFLGLKLDAVVAWSWVVVFLPTWIPIVVVGVLMPISLLCSDNPVRVNVALLLGCWGAAALLAGPPLLLVLRLQFYAFPATYVCLPWFVLYGLCVLGTGVFFMANPAPKAKSALPRGVASLHPEAIV
ncbi:hypothetical protein ACHHYP_10174 [Achlya hypogyna]|uniref:Uncharacterized protein n=1 Tax=Achlya hypogyna TaxID=1202772 RepID=A0A1V9ZI25_ACHHY|nr:hypothetical protein ACHHYP_10174 [Achlya hypogyna]